MPKIPMAEKAGLIRHVSDTVHMTGAPDLNWKLGEGQALINMGDRLGRGADRLGNAALEFGRQMQHKEDVLAATEDRNLFHKLNGELYSKLANTPGASDQEKNDWIAGYKLMYEDGRAEILSRMSGDFRKQHEAEMNGLRIHADYRRMELLKQGQVQRTTDLYQGLLKDAALRGDEKEYRRILDEAQEGVPLFSEETKKRLELDYNRLAQEGEAKRRIAAGDRDIAEVLKETDGDGRYVNYPAMHEEYRMKLLKYAETEEAKRRAAENEELVNRLWSGEVITEEEIEKAFEGQETAGARERKKAQLAIVKKFQERKSQEQEKLAKEQEKLAESKRKEQARNAEAKRKKLLDSVEYKIMTTTFSSDAVERERQYAERKSKIFRDFANDGPTVKRLLGQLDEVYKAAAKPDTSYKHSFAYQASMEYLKTFDPSKLYWFQSSEFKTYAKAGDWTRTKNAEQEKASYKTMAVALDGFFQRHPQATFEDAKKYIDGTKKFIGQQAAKDLVSAWLKAESGEIDAGWK